MKSALILGIGGQDGSYLAEVLLERGYKVSGLYRHSSCDNLWRIRHILNRVTLFQGDITDIQSVDYAIRKCLPDEIYNEADQDNVRWSYKIPEASFSVSCTALLSILELIKNKYQAYKTKDKPKFFQPLSATIFGNSPPPQSEESELNPSSPYACSKAASYHICRFYRNYYGVFVSTGIMFNHDSPRREGDYLLHTVKRNILKSSTVEVYNPEFRVDIGYAKDYMEAANDLMQLETPNDYVLATGVGTSIANIYSHASHVLGKKIKLVDTSSPVIQQQELIGDITRAKDDFLFRPKHSTKDVTTMVMKGVDG